MTAGERGFAETGAALEAEDVSKARQVAGDALAAALINALAYVPEGRTRLQGFAALNDWPHSSTYGLYPQHALIRAGSGFDSPPHNARLFAPEEPPQPDGSRTP